MDVETFKTVVFSLAQKTGYDVSDIRKPEMTPNFYSCSFENQAESFWVLASLDDKWAMAEDLGGADSLKLTFLDSAELFNAMKSLFDIDFLRVEHLDAPFEVTDENISDDVRYWKPETVGQYLFNWWD